MSYTSASSYDSSRPNRRWFRYSLRTLLLLITLVCVVLGFKIVPVLEQKRAVSAVQELGGQVIYDYEFKKKVDRPPSSEPPDWISGVLGVDFSHDVAVAKIFNVRDTDRVKKALPSLRHLRSLHELDLINIKDLRDNDFEFIDRMSELQDVAMYGDQLRGDVLQHLQNLAHLRKLALMWNQIDDQGLAFIAGTKELQTLDLDQNQVTDAGLQHLANLAELKYLVLAKNQISGDGLKHLANLKKLNLLVLDDNPITDESIKSITTLPHLTLLSIARTNVTDACIESLAKLPDDCEICVSGTKITPDGVRRIQKLLPNSAVVIQGNIYDNNPNGAAVVFATRDSD
jgi:hypothetical protein